MSNLFYYTKKVAKPTEENPEAFELVEDFAFNLDHVSTVENTPQGLFIVLSTVYTQEIGDRKPKYKTIGGKKTIVGFDEVLIQKPIPMTVMLTEVNDIDNFKNKTK